MRIHTRKLSLCGLILATALLTGCATTAKYNTMVSAWKGQKAEALVNTWGYPDRTITAPDGNPVYVYTRHEVTQVPAYTNGGYTQVSTQGGQTTVLQTPVYTTGGQTFYSNCTTWFEIDKNDQRIVNISFRGNACRL